MGNAALLIDNMADDATVGASSQEQTMPASNLLTPHPSERWRSTSNTAWFVLDKRDGAVADTVAVYGLTGGTSLTARLRLSLTDSTGADGAVLDTGTLLNGSAYLDVEYGALVYLMPAALAWRYARVDLTDPDADYVEAGCVVAGAREAFTYNFAPGAGITTIDRSRVGKTSGGLTLTWPDNLFRRLELSFDWVTALQRFGLFERMNRSIGNHKNVLMMIDTASANLARDSIFGLVVDSTPDAYTAIADIFARQLKIEERV